MANHEGGKNYLNNNEVVAMWAINNSDEEWTVNTVNQELRKAKGFRGGVQLSSIRLIKGILLKDDGTPFDENKYQKLGTVVGIPG